MTPTPAHAHPLLYKYRSFEMAALTLKSRTIRASHPSAFNDLLDGGIHLEIPEMDEEMRSVLAEEYASLVFAEKVPDLKEGSPGRKIVELWRMRRSSVTSEALCQEISKFVGELSSSPPTFRQKAGESVRVHDRGPLVFCLSKNAESMPMWYHYAEKYAGVVIVFNGGAHPQSMFTQCRPIRYVPSVPLVYERPAWAKLCTGQKLDEIELVYRQFFTKSDQWSYEEEVRLLLGQGGPGSYRDVTFDSDEFEGIIFGSSTAAVHVEQLKALARDFRPDCRFWKAQLDRTRFGFEIVPYSA